MKIDVKGRDALWSYIATFLSMGSGIIIVPLILRYLNDEEVAIYYIFTSLSAIALLFDFGFSPSIARSITYAWSGADKLWKQGVEKTTSSAPNFKLMNKVIVTCKIIYTTLAFAALLLCLSIGTLYVKYVTRHNFNYIVCISWVIYAFAIFLNILYSYYSVFLRGVGAVEKVNKATVLAKSIQLILSFITLLNGVGLIGVAFSYLLYGISFRFLAKYWFYSYEKIGEKLKANKDNDGLRDIREILDTIWPNTWKDGLVTLSNYLLNQATTVIASLFLSLQQTGIYSLNVQLTSVIATVAATIYTTYQPALQSAYANRDKEMQRKYMSLIVASYVIAFTVGMMLLVTIGVPFVEMMKPTYKIDFCVLLCIGIYQFLLKYRNCYTSYISTTNRLIYYKSFLFSAVICVILSFLFSGLLDYGVYGLIFAQLFSQIMYNAWKWPLLVHKELELDSIDIFRIGCNEMISLVFQKKRGKR